ncbi:MAG: hypothetical protein COA94_08375 [Rickettsiales bacterium]|nr:MAG: hypothetical protein COA94_08375 [Rickettsiales bacterium]
MSTTKTNLSIVLDLDETLLHTITNVKSLIKMNILGNPNKLGVRERLYIINMNDGNNMWGIYRPHLREFINFCFDYFKHVCVWSAGSYEYVHKIVHKIFSGINKPHIVYTRNDMKIVAGEMRKPLSHLMVGCMNSKNTLILEDRYKSFSVTDPNNGLLIPAYLPSSDLLGVMEEDNHLEALILWLSSDKISHCSDIREVDKISLFV